MNDDSRSIRELWLDRRTDEAGRASNQLPGLPEGVAAWHASSPAGNGTYKVLDGNVYPERFQVTYTGPSFGSVTMSFRWDQDRLVCHGCEFASTELHTELRARDLHEFPFLALFEDAITRVALAEGHWAMAAIGPVPTDASTFPAPRDRVLPSVNRRRQKVTVESLQRVAEIVRAHPKASFERADATASREAYAAICNEFHLGSIRTAQLWVKRAKDKGLL